MDDTLYFKSAMADPLCVISLNAQRGLRHIQSGCFSEAEAQEIFEEIMAEVVRLNALFKDGKDKQ